VLKVPLNTNQPTCIQGCHFFWKSGKVGEFENGKGNVRENAKSRGIFLSGKFVEVTLFLRLVLLQEKDVIEEYVMDRVQSSYRQTSSEMTTLLNNKLKYLEALQL